MLVWFLGILFFDIDKGFLFIDGVFFLLFWGKLLIVGFIFYLFLKLYKIFYDCIILSYYRWLLMFEVFRYNK